MAAGEKMFFNPKSEQRYDTKIAGKAGALVLNTPK